MRSYRGYRRAWTGADWARHHKQQREQVSARFGGIDKDIEAAFLSLPTRKRNDLFCAYGKRYGPKPEAYARATYAKWRAGQVKMSGQTAERLLQLLPPRLSFDVRFNLIKKLRTRYLRPQIITLSTDLLSWREAVLPAVETIVARAELQNLPDDVTRVAHWLTDADARLAHDLITKIEQEEARARTALLEQEFVRISAMIDHLDHAATSASHTIQIPNGEIRVKIAVRRRDRALLQTTWRPSMSNDKHDDDHLIPQTTHGSLPTRRAQENLLDVATSGLSPEEIRQLRGKALDARLELDVAARQADERFLNSSRDMANTVRLAGELDQGRNDYDINASYDTASGRTAVRVKRATNQTLVVVAVVIAVIVLLIFLSQ